MKRFLFLSGILWLCVMVWSSTASATHAQFDYATEEQAWTTCLGYRTDEPYSGCYRPDPSIRTLKWYLQSWDKTGSGTTFGWHAGGDCPTDQPMDTTTGLCSAPPETPQSCDENGTYWQESTSSCVAICPSGALDHYCLEQAPEGEPDTDQDGNECSPSSPDYQGIFSGKHYCDSNLPEPATCPAGQMAVIQLDDSGSGAFACGEPITSPENAADTETETTTTTTDENGNTTTTTTDGDGNTTTTTTDAQGNSTTINNYPGIDSETGGPCTASSVACVKTPETQKGICKDGGSLCDDVNKIKDAITKEHTRESKTGKFDDEAANTEVATAETELTNGLNQIKAEIGGYFDLALSAGDMACGPGVDVLGTTIQICPSEMKEELAVIAQIVMLIAGLISLMIVFR